MPESPEQELQTYFDQLIESTGKGEIQWKESNPTTYVWSSGKDALFTLQRTERMVQRQVGTGRMTQMKEQIFIFQAYEIPKVSGQAILRFAVNGGDNSAVNARLHALFSSIKSKATEQSLEFLKQHLPGPGGQ